MRKIKLLFDVEQLAVAGLKGTGIVRVCDELLQGLNKVPEVEVFPIVTAKYGDFEGYLKAKGLYDTFKNKIVYLPKLKATTKGDNLYQKVRSYLLCFIYRRSYQKVLKKYDAYLSLFSPISPIVYQSLVKTYMVIHDLIPIYYPDGCSPKFVKKFTRWMKQANADAYFCISSATIKDFLRFRRGLKTAPVYKLYLGADDKFKPIHQQKIMTIIKEKYHIKTDKYFLAVSELTARKNLPHLLESFILFLNKTKAKDVSLVLVGPKREGYETLHQMIDGLDIYQNKIITTGFVLDEDLPVLYNGAEAFIYPSLYEGFGLPILEAMKAGVPVITADNTSLPEVAGDAGLYITGKDTNETSNALMKLYQDKNLAHRLRQKGLKQAQKFNWQTTIETIVRVLKRKQKEK